MYRTSPFGFGVDPYSRYSPNSHHPTNPYYAGNPYASRAYDEEAFYDPYEHERAQQKQRLLQQQKQQQQQRARQQQQRGQGIKQQGMSSKDVEAAKLAQQQKIRQQKLLKLETSGKNKFARKIQGWWRGHQQARQQQRQQEASFVVQRFMRQLVAKIRCNKFIKAVKNLRSIESKMNQTGHTFSERILGRVPGTKRDMLLFEDSMDKLIISTDGIDVLANQQLRQERKRVVMVANKWLTDMHKLEESAIVFQRAYRAHRLALRELKKPHAAEVILRSFRRLRARKAVQPLLGNIRNIRALDSKLSALLATFNEDLKNLSNEADAIPDSSQTAHGLKQRVSARVTDLLSRLADQRPSAQ